MTPWSVSYQDPLSTGILQARILEWVAKSSSKDLPDPGIKSASLVSFVKDKVTIGAWIYLWAFYLVPLVYISVFMPVP